MIKISSPATSFRVVSLYSLTFRVLLIFSKSGDLWNLWKSSENSRLSSKMSCLESLEIQKAFKKKKIISWSLWTFGELSSTLKLKLVKLPLKFVGRKVFQFLFSSCCFSRYGPKISKCTLSHLNDRLCSSIFIETYSWNFFFGNWFFKIKKKKTD